MTSKIVVNKSGIHGKGIFAKRDIKKGEIVCIIKGEKKFKINRNIKDVMSHPDWVGFKMNYWIDPISPYKFLNHSCNPNSAVKGRVEIIAIENIKRGEEITIDYSITEMDKLWYMKCKCKNRNCRKVIRSIQFLPQKQFKKYLPFVPTYFKNIYLKNQI